MTDLGTLGGVFGVPNYLNNQGQVVGQSDLSGDVYAHAFLWPGKGGKMQDFGTLGGTSSLANWINEAGVVVGGSWTSNNQGFDAFLWKHGVITDLGPLNGCSMALGINSKGQVVGFNCGTNGYAALWDDGQIIDLNIFNYPGSGIQQLLTAYNINDQGEIAGLGVPPGCGDEFSCGHVFALIPCDEKHRDEEGCHEGNSTKEVPLPRPTLREPARPVPPRTLPKWSSRYRGFSSTGSDRVANDPRDAAAPSNPPGSGYCGVDTNDTLTGICIGADGFHCIDQVDKRQCPPGKKAIAPTNFSCQIRQVTRVDGARNCPVCGGRCVFGRCGLPGCACGKDGFCHRVGGEALKELLWDPQPESAFTNP
jgi:probable HAF family extracellular repeat protein